MKNEHQRGVAWFGGSALLGILYDQTSALWVTLVSAALITQHATKRAACADGKRHHGEGGIHV